MLAPDPRGHAQSTRYGTHHHIADFGAGGHGGGAGRRRGAARTHGGTAAHGHGAADAAHLGASGQHRGGGAGRNYVAGTRWDVGRDDLWVRDVLRLGAGSLWQ
eukprot:366341-Chlamydomonas_euryale.AAC.16